MLLSKVEQLTQKHEVREGFFDPNTARAFPCKIALAAAARRSGLSKLAMRPTMSRDMSVLFSILTTDDYTKLHKILRKSLPHRMANVTASAADPTYWCGNSYVTLVSSVGCHC